MTSVVFCLLLKLLAFAGTSPFLHRVLQFSFSRWLYFINWFLLRADQFAGDRKMLKNTANKTQAKYAAIATQNRGSFSSVLSKQLNTVYPMDIPANAPAMWAAKDTLGEKGKKWKLVEKMLITYFSCISHTKQRIPSQSHKSFKCLKSKLLRQETQNSLCTEGRCSKICRARKWHFTGSWLHKTELLFPFPLGHHPILDGST